MPQQANTRVVNGINTRVLHNKDYVEVSERVRILHELRKAGEIKEFEMVESQPCEIANRLIWRCSALIDNKLYIGNAEVKLDAPKNTPDGTNPFECAETSAFGRMLAFAGLGTVESIASYEEVVRGQPFVAVIEQSQQRVVEATSQRQIAQPKPQAHVVESAPSSNIHELIGSMKKRTVALGLCNDAATFKALLQEATGEVIDEKDLTLARIAKVNGHLTQVERQRKAS